MGRFITNFDTTAELATFSATTDFGRPHVSLTKDGSKVHYFKDPYNGHDYVDLGLSSGTMWAKMNIGASNETDYGNYYQYGKGADQYAATSGDSKYRGTEDPLDSSVDTAVQVWGGQWHMPTKVQCQELIANTTYQWTSINGVNGGKFISKTDTSKYIFLPAAKFWYNGSLTGGTLGYYRSSTPDNSTLAYCLRFGSGLKTVNNNSRDYGCSVRPVVG